MLTGEVQNNVDLIFYFHTDILHGLNAGLATKLRATLATANATRCFRTIKFMNARLSPSEDAYPMGPSNMFFKLWNLRAMTEGYDWMYYMEPDNRPCRSGWLEALCLEAWRNSGTGLPEHDTDGAARIEELEMEEKKETVNEQESDSMMSHSQRNSQAVNEETKYDEDVEVIEDATGFIPCPPETVEDKVYKWHMEGPPKPSSTAQSESGQPAGIVSPTKWMLGSILRPHTEPFPLYTFADHINGNALYRISSAPFKSFIRVVELMLRRRPQAYIESYDIAIYLVARDRKVTPWESYARIVGRFGYTDVIQNWYRTELNATELCARERTTYLLHGRELVF
ncbi:hypothetical protein HDU93_008927 [Gonapodya sp. JEL0774]|nr:hypothetical protein HDU93_008927 [Gonapodya sp. JEL0774]